MPLRQMPAYIALGSNLGNSVAQCQQAIARLKALPQCTFKSVSSFYKSAALTKNPQDAADTPAYINAVVCLSTSLAAEKLMAQLIKIETSMGRTRTTKWASRLIDLDLIALGEIVCQSSDLTLPHPEMTQRLFVLQPLAEINPEWIHPQTKQSLPELIQKAPASTIQRLPIEFISAL